MKLSLHHLAGHKWAELSDCSEEQLIAAMFAFLESGESKGEVGMTPCDGPRAVPDESCVTKSDSPEKSPDPKDFPIIQRPQYPPVSPLLEQPGEHPPVSPKLCPKCKLRPKRPGKGNQLCEECSPTFRTKKPRLHKCATCKRLTNVEGPDGKFYCGYHYPKEKKKLGGNLEDVPTGYAVRGGRDDLEQCDECKRWFKKKWLRDASGGRMICERCQVIPDGDPDISITKDEDTRRTCCRCGGLIEPEDEADHLRKPYHKKCLPADKRGPGPWR